MAWSQKQLDELMKNGASGLRILSSKEKNPAQKPAVKENGKGRYPSVTPVSDPQDGEKIDSKLEAKHRAEYRLMLKSGLLTSYSRQPEFILPGGIKWRGDHLLIHLDGSIEIVDSKGIETPDFKMKMKLMAEAHPNIKILIRKAEPRKRKSK